MIFRDFWHEDDCDEPGQQAIQQDGRFPHRPSIQVIAMRDIEAGEQLIGNYGPFYWDDDGTPKPYASIDIPAKAKAKVAAKVFHI